MINFKLPEEVNTVFDTLSKNGYEGYLVGGCIRDLIMNKTPKDYDFAVSSLPPETERCFKDYKVIKTGLKHGTLTVNINNYYFELTTFRTEGKYLDSRHPSLVSFTPSLEEDLKRRDFTVNAIAYNHKKGIIDLFEGERDIERKIIACVGNPYERFSEDALRIIRGLRFASVLGFSISEDTKRAIHSKKALLKNISVERIYEELNKLICGNPDEILEEFKDVFSLILYGFSHKIQLNALPADRYLRYALIVKPADLKALNADKQTLNTLKELQYIKDLNFKNKSDFLFELGKLKYASLALVKEYLSIISPESKDILNEIFEYAKNNCISIKQLDINGTDLLNAGFNPGVSIKTILNKLLMEVISGKTYNEKEKLLTRAKELI